MDMANTYEKLFITPKPDGSLCRNYPVPFSPPTGDLPPLDSSTRALSKDVPLNTARGTSIRIFMPDRSLSRDDDHRLLPVVIYFHPGGFILCSPAIAPVHNFTAQMAAQLPAVVLSVDHRLAPEHRLPAAYEDAADALLWVRDQALYPAAADPWLKDHADFSQCFLMGSSSGGNIAYHLSLHALQLDVNPVRIAGFIMDQPFFGGEERTASEIKMADDPFVPLAVTDLMWELALPVGANRDHEYSKPRQGAIKGRDLPRCLVRGYVGDPLIDRIRLVAAMLEEEGASVVSLLDEEGYHGVELHDAKKAEELVDDLRMFVYRDILWFRVVGVLS